MSRSYVPHTLWHRRMWVDARVCGIRLMEVHLAMAMKNGSFLFSIEGSTLRENQKL